MEKEDFATARLATEKVSDDKVQADLEMVIAFGEIAQDLKLKAPDLDELSKRIYKMPESLEKGLLYLSLSAAAKEARNRQQERESLELAHTTAVKLDDKVSPFILLSIAGSMKQNKDQQASTVFAEAVKAFNRSDKIPDPELRHSIGLAPVIMRFPLDAKGINLDFHSSFTKAVAGEEDDAVSAVHDILDERLKAQAYVSLAKFVTDRSLTVLPKAGPSK